MFILVVDDDEDIRSVLSDVLEAEGCAVTTAAHGRQALDRLSDSRDLPGLILLDLMMPVMDGPSFLAALQTDCTLSKIPVVVISAYQKIAESLDGISGILRKPFELTDLLHHAERYCSAAPPRS
jgi:CheY-like chemotaxis protein